MPLRVIAQCRSRELFGGRGIYAGPKAERLLEDMLVYSDAIDTNNNLHLYRGHLVAFDLRWNIVAGIRARHWMDDTLHRCSSDTAVDGDRDVEESGTAVHTGIAAKRKSRYKTCVTSKFFYVENFMETQRLNN